MSLVVVGTDTEVGKTVVSATMLARYGRRFSLSYWKPVATGASHVLDSDLVRRWVGHLVEILPETYVYGPPVSPHLAAKLARHPIDPDRILENLVHHALADRTRSLVIEGIGGVLVPLVESGYLLADLLRDLCLPCVLVARSTLGTINHTLLALEALRSRSVDVAGVVLNGPRDRENRRAIEKFGSTGVLAELEPICRLGRAGIAQAARKFDVRARMGKYFC